MTVRLPSVEQLSDISRSFGLALSDDDLLSFRELMRGPLASCDRLDEMIEPKLPVRYPRAPGYRPPASENPYNAWYWKTDIRGALLYAVWKLVERDAKVTTVSWNGIALVQGVEMRLTNNADQSRTFASIYMHENRLLIVEATVPRGDAPPVSFNESLNWLDESGRPVRYQTTYVNIPDVPKPPPRGAPAPAPVSR